MKCIKISCIFLISLLLAGSPAAYSNNPLNKAVQYILKHKKSNGAFGPRNMEYTDLAWTYPAVHALNILGAGQSLYDSAYVNGGKAWIEKAGWRNGPWYWSLHQKANLYKLMNESGNLENDFPKEKAFQLRFMPRTRYVEAKWYTDGRFFDMASLWNLVEAIEIMNGNVTNEQDVVDYILARQAENGAFDDMLGSRTSPNPDQTHILVTHDAVMVLNALNREIPHRDKLIEWIRACQDEHGGFRWNPGNESNSNKPDVWYTWAALKLLNVLDEKPERTDSCLQWLCRLQNPDGGFGDRPGWNSRLYSSYYALHALELLEGGLESVAAGNIRAASPKEPIPEGKYSIFQAQHKTPAGGTGMVDSVVAMGFNLVGVKTTEKEVIASGGMSKVVEEARKYAKEKNYNIEILDCPENYAHKIKWFTGMDGDHCSNMLLPPDMSGNLWKIYMQAYDEGLKGHDWETFGAKVIRPVLDSLNSLVYPELDYTMLNAYRVYDEGLDGRTGYNGVPAAHFNNIDWVRHFPYKERWIGHLPMIADGDAHGDMVKWRPNLEYFRNVFIAESYNYHDYIDASLNGRSVCVIRMPETHEIRYYGADMAVEYLKKHIDEWKWW